MKLHRLLTIALALLITAGTLTATPKNPPGVAIAQTPNPDKDFVGSPSILILPNGDYLASHDFFGGGTLLHSSDVYTSSDKGATWTKLAHLPGQFWSTLFYHNGATYLMGCDAEYGNIVIRKSTDNGHTWTNPKNAETGKLTGGWFGKEYHCAAVPVVIHDGRIWRAYEEYKGETNKNGRQMWSGQYFNSLVISAPVDADLLNAKSWTRSNTLQFDENVLPGDKIGWLEGNIVPTPDGKLVNILRMNDLPVSLRKADYDHPAPYDKIPRFELAAVIQVKDAKTIKFDPATGLIHFPGGITKFTIRYDPVSKLYYSIANKITYPFHGYAKSNSPGAQRNVLILTSSPDLVNWTERTTLLRWSENTSLPTNNRYGFQYVDWLFDGDDIIAVVRTAWDGQNYHNSNYMTFHRFKNFRTLTQSDSPPDLEQQ